MFFFILAEEPWAVRQLADGYYTVRGYSGRKGRVAFGGFLLTRGMIWARLRAWRGMNSGGFGRSRLRHLVGIFTTTPLIAS